MKVAFTKEFNKTLRSINNKRLAGFVSDTIKDVERAKSPWEINSIKKIQGHKTAYRIRKGNFRIGVFIEKDEVLFAAVDHRKDIYKKFP